MHDHHEHEHERDHLDGHGTHTQDHDPGTDDAREWDGFYLGDGDDVPHWSGEPNPTLVAEAATLRPGRALDVGCGEGGDAVWLASRGWQVTAIDPSRVALDRARSAARAAGVDVTWIAAGLLDLPDALSRDATSATPPSAAMTGYDLVTAHYPVLPRGDDDAASAALLRAVAPGGTLLVVHHELDASHAAEHGFDLSAHVTPDSLATQLDADWEIELFERRDHPGGHADDHPAGHASDHPNDHPGDRPAERPSGQAPPEQPPRDIVLRARRR